MSISENKKETINSGALAITGNLLGKVISLPVGMYVASTLSPTGYGLLAIVLIIIQYLGILNLGVLSNITREVPIAYGKNNLDEVKTIYDTVFSNYLITTLIGILILWILHLGGLNYNGQLSTIHFFLISFIVLTANAESFFHTYLKGEGKFLIYGQYELVSKIANPIVTLVLVYFFELNGMLLTLIFTHLFGLGFILSKIDLPILKLGFNLNKTKELFSTGIWMYFNKVIDGFFISVVILLASKFLTSSEVGILSFALGFAAISKIPFATILIVTVDHRMAKDGGKVGLTNYKNYSKFFGTTYVIYLLIISLVLGILVIFYSIVVNIFLQEYILAIPIMIILFFALNFYNARYFLNSYINATQQMKTRSVILVVGLFINVILGYFSIQLGFGIIGMSFVVAFSMIFISTQTIFIVFRQVFDTTIKGYFFLIKVLIISLLLSAALYSFKEFTFVSYEHNYHDIFQMFLAFIDFSIKCILFIILVLILYIRLFRTEKVYAEIRILLHYSLSNLISAIRKLTFK